MSPAAVKPRVRISTTPEERAEWVRLFEESGKSAAQFCQELGLAETTFAVWRRQVRDASSAGEVSFTDIPVPLVDEPVMAIVLPNGTRLEVTPGTDPAWLARLLPVLKG